MSDNEIVPLDEGVDGETRHIVYRASPTTSFQKADFWLQDAKNFIKKYKWLLFFCIVIPLVIAFLYFVSVTTDLKEALRFFFVALGNFIVVILSFFFANIGAGLVASFVAYMLGKKLLHRERILFEEFDGERMPVMTMRKTEEEIIIYKNRKNFLATLLRGKIQIKIGHETFDILESVGEKKIVTIDNEEYEVLKIYVLPESEMDGEKMFIKNKDGEWTFNTAYLLDKNDVEEYVLKSQLPDVDPAVLRRTLVNLTKKNNAYRTKIATMERELDEELERKFWDYLSYQTPKESYGKQILRKKWKDVLDTETKMDELLLKQYEQQVLGSYREENEGEIDYE